MVGVGGQGIVLASTVISLAALRSGVDVKNNEVHGMAQRGGSVMAHVRFGAQVYSPLIEPGTAQILVALEVLEGIRHAHYVAQDGVALVNTQRIVPVTVTSGQAEYPAEAEELAARLFPRLVAADCYAAAHALGNARVVNSIMIGMLSRFLAFTPALYEEILFDVLPEKLHAVNLRAFAQGREMGLTTHT